MYTSNEDLPFVCQLNLPEAAQHVYRTAFNRAWSRAAEAATRFHLAQTQAWEEVRKQFERDGLSGRWVPRATELKPHVAPLAAAPKSAQG
jgi:cation transport regulator